jgi:hypothetical protein
MMSVNLNAQGMDDIESLMKLMTKVNPDMINQPEKAQWIRYSNANTSWSKHF